MREVVSRPFVTGIRVRTVAIILVVGALAGAATTASSARAADPDRLPAYTSVQKLVRDYFASQPGYERRDIISQRDAVAILADLDKLGWKVADRREILDRVPADNELLVRELRTSAGRKFMRQMDRYPDAYDRLDRLTHMPQGTSTLKRLVAGPDGYKLIEYLTTASGGREMGKMLSNTPRGRGFNRSTDRIYTQRLLMQALKARYKEAGGEIPADVEQHEQAEAVW
jgi:hypothetical protein